MNVYIFRGEKRKNVTYPNSERYHADFILKHSIDSSDVTYSTCLVKSCLRKI